MAIKNIRRGTRREHDSLIAIPTNYPIISANVKKIPIFVTDICSFLSVDIYLIAEYSNSCGRANLGNVLQYMKRNITK